MAPKPKKKLCWNCEGTVTFKDENCSFCGVYLSPTNSPGDNNSNNLLSPPYQMEKNEEQEIPDAPYAESNTETPSKPSSEALKQGNDFKNLLLITVLLLAGTLFVLFASILLLFSHNGVFTLRWNGDLWFVYLGIAIPMLFFGWHRLQQITD